MNSDILEEKLDAINDSLKLIAQSLERLGSNGASGPMGAIESLGDHLGRKLDALTEAVNETDTNSRLEEFFDLWWGLVNGDGDTGGIVGEAGPDHNRYKFLRNADINRD